MGIKRYLPRQHSVGFLENVVMRKLAMLNRAEIITDLRLPPANRLETLKGNTIARDAELLIDHVPLKGKCKNCGSNFQINNYIFKCKW